MCGIPAQRYGLALLHRHDPAAGVGTIELTGAANLKDVGLERHRSPLTCYRDGDPTPRLIVGRSARISIVVFAINALTASGRSCSRCPSRIAAMPVRGRRRT